MSVSTVFEFDPTEHYRAARAVTRSTPARWITRAFGAVGLGMLAYTVLPAWGRVPPGTLVVSALPWLLLTAFWVTLIPLLQRRAARKLPERDASMRGAQERAVDATGFHSRGNGVVLDVPWHAMARAVETEQFFLFFYNKQCAYYLPKRALAPGQVAEVRKLARGGLGARARLMSD